MEGIADLTSPWGPLSLKRGKGSKHCTREHCKVGRRLAARVAVEIHVTPTLKVFDIDRGTRTSDGNGNC